MSEKRSTTSRGSSEKRQGLTEKPSGSAGAPEASHTSRSLSFQASRAQRRWVISPDALFRPLEDEAVILDMSSQRYFGLSSVGVRIWQLLEELGETAAVTETLLSEYEVDETRLRSDVDELIAGLAAQGLIRPATDEPSAE